MTTKALLVFQGGGAMGAYQCGAYKAISAHLRDTGIEVAGVAGASIGAINAALIARHLKRADGGAELLERFWREDLATPLAIVPLPSWYLHCWNSVLTMLLFGHPGLSRPNYLGWTPWAMAWGGRLALHDPAPLAQLLDKRLGSFGPNPGSYPLLLIRAVNATTQQPAVFHSWQEALTARQLVASCSVPVLLPLAELDGESYWDGDILPYSPLRDLLRALRSRAGPDNAIHDYLAIIVDCVCGEGHKPDSTLDLVFQVQAALLAPRADSDEHYASINNRYLDFLDDCAAAVGSGRPTPLTRLIARERKSALGGGLRRLDIVRIRRHEALPFEYVSRDLDYSRERVDLLIDQGERDARDALDDHARGE